MAGRDPGRRRVGYVVNAFPVVSQTFLLNELLALETHGIPVAVFALQQTREKVVHGGAARLAATVHGLPATGANRWVRIAGAQLTFLLRRPLRYFSVARGLRHRRLRDFLMAVWLAAKARDLDVVHLHAYFVNQPLAVAELAARLLRVPHSAAAHAKDLFRTAPTRIARGLERAEFCVACHHEGERHLRSIVGDGHTPVILVRHGTDTALFTPGDDAMREDGLIVAVGRLTPKKGFLDLVAACARLRDRGRIFRCTIIGDGRQRAELEQAITDTRLDDIIAIRGFEPQESVAWWYRRAAVVAAPCRQLEDGNRDGIPNVVVEAMACAAPVVATSAGSVPDVIGDGVTGRLVPPGDPEALAAAFAKLLDDRAFAHRLGHAAAAAARAMDYRETTMPLVRRFERITRVPAGVDP